MKAAMIFAPEFRPSAIEAKDKILFFIAVRSIVFKLHQGEAPISIRWCESAEMIHERYERKGVERSSKWARTDQKSKNSKRLSLLELIKIKLPIPRVNCFRSFGKSFDEFKQINKIKELISRKKMQHFGREVTMAKNQRTSKEAWRFHERDQFDRNYLLWRGDGILQKMELLSRGTFYIFWGVGDAIYLLPRG